jgi:hypothetical protein
LTKFDPLRGALGPFQAFGDYAVNWDLFAEEWPSSLEEQLATYRLLCADSTKWVPTVVLERGDNFCPRFLKTPEEQKQGLALFLPSLKDTPAGHLRHLLILSASPDPVQADAAYRGYLAGLWTQRDAFAHCDGYAPNWACARELPEDVAERNAAAALPLLHYVLTRRDISEINDVPLTVLWHPAGWTRADAGTAWNEYLAYKSRTHGDSLLLARDYEDPFKRQFPDLAVETEPPPPPPSADALVATKFWYPWHYLPVDGSYYDSAIVAGESGRVWAAVTKPGRPPFLVQINTDDFSSHVFPVPDGLYPRSFICKSDALYALTETNGHDGSGGPLPHEIVRLDPVTATWTTRAIPDCFNAELFSAGNAFYLFLSLKFAGNDDVVDRYDWDKDTVTILASTRRRPAQNQFDDRPRLLLARIFTGPGGKPCVATMEGTFYLQDTPGRWPPVFDSRFDSNPVTIGAQTLMVGNGEIVLLDPQRADPVPLMAPQAPTFRHLVPPGAQPVKTLAPWAAQAPWDPPDGPPFYYSTVAYHDGSLYLLRKPQKKGGDYELLCYQRGNGRAPRDVPLEFHLDEAAKADLAEEPAGAPLANGPWTTGLLEHPDTIRYPSDEVVLFCTESGICIQPQCLGFWFLPYADIEAYLKAHRPADAASVKSAPRPASPVIGDEVDPNDITTFY